MLKTEELKLVSGWESAAENFLRRKNCYSFCNSGKTFI